MAKLWAVLVGMFLAAWSWGFMTGAAGKMVHLLLVAAVATGLLGILLSGRRSILHE